MWIYYSINKTSKDSVAFDGNHIDGTFGNFIWLKNTLNWVALIFLQNIPERLKMKELMIK
jgi:hypothetical protein